MRPMWIEVADKSGFCFGVERAIRLTEEAARRFGEVWSLGSLIHNSIVTDSLEKKGVHIAESVEQAAGKPLVIRSHGVAAETKEKARQLCGEVIDATCPFVAKIHGIVSAASVKAAVVLGDKDHPEIIGIMGHAAGRVYACADAEEMEKLFENGTLSDSEDVVLVVQTTFDRGRFTEYSERIRRNHSRVKIYDTICHATSERQKNAEELAKRAALMIVVGGRSSSNTGALAAICSRHCKTVFAESAADIPRQILSGLRSDSLIGITAGASTPVYTIKEVHERMNEEIKSVNENEEDFAALLEADQSFIKLRNGMRVKATVVSVSDREVGVEVGAKQTGYIVREELTNDPEAAVGDIVKVGDVIDAIVIKVDDSMGTAALSKKRVDTALGLEKMMAVKDSNETIEGVVSNVVKGGVIVFSDNTRIFIPASQTGIPRSGSLDTLLKQTVKLKIIEVNDQRGGRVVGSIKLANKEVRDAERAKFWENIEVGQKFVGEVRSIEDYGVFVDIGAVDGLVRTSELTWNRVGHPKDIVKIGDKINVIVKSYDPEKKRVSLSAKDPDENPWTKFVAEYGKGDVIKATIVSITEFGAFAQIIPGVDGLIHISQISTERVNNIASVLSVGQEVEVKIIEIDTEKNRVSLSIKALMEETASDDESDDAE
ncbi:MAG: bifunctional 4-hydroxy-3-methylbut-2-enyl diphosphate reductase/30S ribosomal protein S1 [Oscillospiraceae bacterium]|nr:bifunctional 4-hydroxy-3-methylbut-2-enyl diphosphate reductase/30S ribosomal protein S1 [Oscillospiraceae bacterium]